MVHVLTEATGDLGVVLEEGRIIRPDLVYVVALLLGWAEGDLGYVHAVLHDLLAGEGALKLVAAMGAVDGGTRAAVAPSAACAPPELVAGVLHRLHDGEVRWDLVLLSHHVDGYHVVFLHLNLS